MGTRGLLRIAAALVAGLGLAGTASASAGGDTPSSRPYRDDPAIVRILQHLGDNSAVTLPPFAIDAKVHIYGSERNGPSSKPQCNKMAYAPERETALYHGAAHQTIISNDVWEFHLGSNAYHQPFPPEGGNQGRLKRALLYGTPNLRTNPNWQPATDEEREYWKKVEARWKEHVVLRNGQLTTTGGGPLMVRHTLTRWSTSRGSGG